MPEITVTYERYEGEPDEVSYPALDALLQEEAEKHPEGIFRYDSSRREDGATLIATQRYDIAPEAEADSTLLETVSEFLTKPRKTRKTKQT